MANKKTHKQSEDVKTLKRVFRIHNHEIFDDTLEPVKIVCGRIPADRPSYSGNCTVWDVKTNQIVMYFKCLDPRTLLFGLLHEMVHLDLIQRHILHGHDETFMNRCNELSAKIGLVPINDSNLCSIWPESAYVLTKYPNTVFTRDPLFEAEYEKWEQQRAINIQEYRAAHLEETA
jgi:hypothetical protein